MTEVLVVDGQHSVIATEPAVFLCQPSLKQVQHKHSRLICSAHQLDAELLRRVTLV